jgi:hypothetical protein
VPYLVSVVAIHRVSSEQDAFQATLGPACALWSDIDPARAGGHSGW